MIILASKFIYFFKNKFFQLVIWWCILPFVFLLFLFLKFGLLLPFLLGFTETLFIFFELFFLFLLFKKYLDLKKSVFFLFSFIFFTVNCYYLFDFLFFLETKARMSYVLLPFLFEAKFFMSSVDNVLLNIFIIGCVIILSLTFLFFIFIKKNIESFVLSKKISLVFLSILFLLILNSVFLKIDNTYFFDNIVFKDQTKIFRLEETSQYGNEDILEIFSKNEKFKRLNPEKPLLKYTYGFEGEKEFDISIGNEKPHIIFLFLESFRAKDIGVLGGEYDVTPNFDKLSKEGVLFDNFYANGVQTTRATVSSLFGVLPRFSARATQTESEDVNLLGLPEILKENGYHLSFLHNGSLEFQRKKDFFSAHNYDDIFGWEDMVSGVEKLEENSWGIHDEYLMKYSADYLQEKDKENLPVFLTMFTVSNHHPWEKPQDFELIEKEGENKEHGKFLQTMNYTDYSLGLFIDLLKERGLYDKSIIFVMADTAQPQGEHDSFMLIKNCYEENFKIPLLILAPGKLKQPSVINNIASQVDILPTTMDILGIEGQNCSIGNSLMRKTNERMAILNNPFTDGCWALRVGKDKFIYNTANKKSFLYNLKRDPYEKNDIVEKDQGKDYVYRYIIFMTHGLFEKNYKENLFR